MGRIIEIYYNSYDKDWCWALAKRRSGSMGDKETKNSWNPKMNSRKRHYIGVLGEWCWSVLSGHPIDIETIGRGDDGTDFPGGIQVKGADQENMPNLLIPESQYDRKVADHYVLVWVREKTGLILGRITREKMDQVKKFVKQGDKGMICNTWWTDYRHLTKI